MKLTLLLVALAALLAATATAAPPILRPAHRAKGNLPALRRYMLRQCQPTPSGEVCPLPPPRSG